MNARDMTRAEVVMPHAIAVESDPIYNGRLTRYANRLGAMQDSAFFRYLPKDGKPVNVSVGQDVVVSGKHRKLTGADKYAPRYFEYYVLALLSKLLPDGYPNIFLGIAHPPDALAQVHLIKDVLFRKHRIERHDGKVVTYNIRGGLPVDEPGGGFVRAVTSGQSPAVDVIAPTRFGILDVGGKIGSISPVMFYPDGPPIIQFNSGDVFHMGIQDVEKNLEALLRDSYPQLFNREIPRTIIAEAIANRGRQVYVWGEPHDFSAEFDAAVSPLIEAINNIYVSEMEMMRDVGRVYISGGGGGLLFETLRTEVFRQQVFPADALPEIHLANVRGVMYAVQQEVEKKANTELARLFAAEYPPVLVAIDAGNSYGKGTVSHVFRQGR